MKPDQRPATVAGAAQDNYFDEESEDNDSDEEGDIDEDMMDIDWYEICLFSVCCAKLFASQNKVVLNPTILFLLPLEGVVVAESNANVAWFIFSDLSSDAWTFSGLYSKRYITYGQNSQLQEFQQNNRA